jgi:osmotically-inducible protein OsmY
MSFAVRVVVAGMLGWQVICLAFASTQDTEQQERMKEVRVALSGVRPAETEFDLVTFDISRTTVILRGFTIGEKRKESCGAVVKDLSWVGHVLNYVEALPDTYNDEKLRDNIRFVLRKRVPRLFSENRARIRIKVSEGNVTLVGRIEPDDKDALERAIGEIKVEDLVRSVENKTVVAK